MNKELNYIKKLGYVFSVIIVMSGNVAYAIPATDLDCSQCVDTGEIKTNSITSGRIKNGEVKTDDIDGSAITSAKIKNLEVKNADIASNAITTEKIANFSVRTVDIAISAITSGRIKNGEVKTLDIGDQAVTEAKLEQSLQNKINEPSVPQGAITGDIMVWDSSLVPPAYKTSSNPVPTNAVPDASMLYWDSVSESYITGEKPSYVANQNQPVNNMQPFGTVNYIIALVGSFPSRNSISDPTIGEITMFGGNFAPRNWAFCDGQLLAINDNQALFSILGTTYGGDGRTTFGLPDLRGRVPLHAGTGPGLTNRRLGQKSGTETNTILIQ